MQPILKRKEKDEEAKQLKRHAVLLELEPADEERLRAMVAYTDTNQADVLRQCIRHVYRMQFGGGQ